MKIKVLDFLVLVKKKRAQNSKDSTKWSVGIYLNVGRDAFAVEKSVGLHLRNIAHNLKPYIKMKVMNTFVCLYLSFFVNEC